MMKKTRFLTVLLCAAFVLGTAIGTARLPAEAATTVADKEWSYKSGSPTAEYDIETGYTSFHNMDSYGHRMGYDYKVKLDGLVVYLESDDMQSKAIFGFNLAKNKGDYGPDAAKGYWSYNAVVWPGSAVASQTRLVSSVSHNHGADYAIGYNSIAGAVGSAENSVGGGTGATTTFYSSAVWANLDGEFGAKLTFSLVPAAGDVTEDCWCVTIEVTRGTRHGQQPQSVNMYVNRRYMDRVLDENGECWITSYGWKDSTLQLIPNYKLKIEDDNSRAYRENQLPAAAAAATAYQSAIQAITDAETYQASLEARTTLVNAISALRGNDQTTYNGRLEELDALYTADESVQANVKAAVQTYYTTAGEAVTALETEANITSGSISAAASSLAAANAAYGDMKAMLTEANRQEFEALSAQYDYAIDLARAKSWIIAYETMADGLAASQNATEDIVAAKAYRSEYETSTACTLITTVLTEDDRAALEARIAAADAKVVAAEEANAAQVKENYLTAFETALAADLTIKANIDEAKGKYAELTANVAITEEDGELFTRLNTAYDALKAACEAYVTAEIEAVSTLLDAEYTLLSAFRPVRARYNAISVDWLTEANETIAADYAALTAKIEANTFYYVEAYTSVENTSFNEVTLNTAGLLLDIQGSHGYRMNYNKKLDLTQGTEVVVQLNERADTTDTNNLCFSFLLAPDACKSVVNGISVFVWLATDSSRVVIYNNTDDQIAQSYISTPEDGGLITIRIKYGDFTDPILGETLTDVYHIEVNEVSFNLTEADLTSKAGSTTNADGTLKGGTVGTDVYFSMGYYMNTTSLRNLLTLVSVDDVAFALPATVSGVSVTTTATTVNVGGTATLRAGITPAEAVPTAVEWYVNGEKMAETGSSYAFRPTAAGEYTVYCVADGVKSNEVSITVNDPNAPDDGDDGDDGEQRRSCNSTLSVGSAGGTLAVLALGAVLLAAARKREQKQ